MLRRFPKRLSFGPHLCAAFLGRSHGLVVGRHSPEWLAAVVGPVLRLKWLGLTPTAVAGTGRFLHGEGGNCGGGDGGYRGDG